ncbi:MAG: hypothetical protein WCE63_08035 [Acidobacteriaceae bacterium]
MNKVFAVSLLLLSTIASAETCKLQTYASSWMVTGTPFSVSCPSGVYTGILVSTPARRFFRRGHLLLKFNQPLVVHSQKPQDEGKIQPGRGRQIASMLMDGGVGIGAKDITDGLSGAIYKSWYAIPISFVTLAFFSTGGDVNLKPGLKLDVESVAGRTNSPSLPFAELSVPK